MKKNVIKTCKSVAKKIKITIKDKTVAIKTDLSLISRLLIASRSRPDIDLRHNLSNYEFSALPKSLFAIDGSMHHCLAKYKLTDALESIQEKPAEENEDDNTSTAHDVPVHNDELHGKAVIVDGMTLLHTYHKPTNSEDM